jgi:hypothetical protein
LGARQHAHILPCTVELFFVKKRKLKNSPQIPHSSSRLPLGQACPNTALCGSEEQCTGLSFLKQSTISSTSIAITWQDKFAVAHVRVDREELLDSGFEARGDGQQSVSRADRVYRPVPQYSIAVENLR